MNRKVISAFCLLLSAFSVHAATAAQPALDGAITTAIANHKLPGGVLWIEHGGKVVYHRAYGNRAVEPKVEAMTEDTIFDAASITKVVATAPSIWLLIQRGKIGLDDPVRKYLPDFTDEAVTLRHLLTHTSGLRPDVDLDDWTGEAEGIRRALVETPRNRPGAVFRYSDINYILLGEIVRHVSGDRLDVFAKREIFDKLRMRDTRFLPVPSERIAPTERGVPRGAVHDPTSRRMGGVAGHAGMFTTVRDLAKFARAMLHGGGGVWKPETVRAMTSVQTPPEVAVKRAAGFDIDSAYSRPRGDHFAIGSFGHTGWTGGFFWVDPKSDTFYIFLSNRVHPDGKGSVTALQKQVGTLVAEAVGIKTIVPRRVDWVIGGADVQNGIDVLHNSGYAALRGLRIGLITNQSGIDRAGNPTIDLLRSAPGVELVALFSPEHGIRGVADANVADEVDPVTKLPVYSLYGERRKPSPEQLKNLDALVFDIQDIGTRFYTYISTLGLAMEAASEAHIKFFVLDRANPINGESVEGPISEGPSEFIAYHPLPVRHGMTVGELAQMFKKERALDTLDLTVVPLKGWKRSMYQDDAGLPWTNPSPNMRSLRAATLYPGIGLLEHSLSVGRGTPTPFEVIGAPFIDGAKLAQTLNVPGVSFEPIRFTPDASNFKGQECGGVRITITDRTALKPVTLGMTIAETLERLYPDQFDLEKVRVLFRHEPKLENWDVSAFMARRQPFLLY